MLRAEVTERDVFVPSPGPGVGVLGGSYYTETRGGRLISIHSLTSRADGIGRRHPRGGYVDLASCRYINVWTEGVLPTDDPLEGMRHWTLHYSVSTDGGRSQVVDEQIIHEGDDYDAVHHLPGVRRGGNCVMMGDLGQRSLTRSDGVLLIPVQSTPAGPDGVYINPGAGYTYTDCMLLLGRWEGNRLRWTCSDRIVGDPARTTRGLIEPTIAELADGSILMIMRGSNDVLPDLPAHKWMSLSHDGGQTWMAPEPWTYDNGVAFHSPSACSQLIPHSDGRLLWMGNLNELNSRGNRPRYPLVIGEVDRSSGRLLRDSVTVIDDRRDGESDQLTLSNFYAREDRETGDLLLHMPRLFARETDEGFSADLLLQRIVLA